MKTAVIGAEGQLGKDVAKVFRAAGHEVIDLSHNLIELADMNSVSNVLVETRPDVVINTAAMHNVDNCEADPVNSFLVNGMGARNLAVVTTKIDAVLIHISTDYVFDGEKRSPYLESDLPLPLNAYGNTKLAGENFIQSMASRYMILRASGLYGHSPCRAKGGLNFVELMLKLAAERDEIRVVDDEILTPTSTIELAQQILKLSTSEAYGLYHATAEGSCSWYAFAGEIFRLTDTSVRLEIAGPDEFPAKTPRPKYSVLENGNLKAKGLNVFKDWKEALVEYLASRS